MAAKEESSSWAYFTEHLFKADDRRLFRSDDYVKQFYDGFETYSIIDNKYPQENSKDKFVLEKEDGNFRQYFSSSFGLVTSILQGHLLQEARRLSLKVLRIICSSEIYPLYQSLAMLVDSAMKMSEADSELEGFTLNLCKNGMQICLYGWDKQDPYWFERKAEIFIEAPETSKAKVNRATERPFPAHVEAVEHEPTMED